MINWNIQMYIFLGLLSQSHELYLLRDYYMDRDHYRAFGGSCGQIIDDESGFINSHPNNLNLVKYSPNRNCWLVLDAGSEIGALYRLEIMDWDLEVGEQNKQCLKDYLEFYDSTILGYTELYGRFCEQRAPNITGFPRRRYVTLKFVTNKVAQYMGFKIKFIKTTPAPCVQNQFHCTAEDRCLDNRLRCDGTTQCTDGLDESSCNVLEKAVGFFQSLGLGGLIGTCVCAVVIICAVIGTCVCCNCSACCKKKKFDDDKLNDIEFITKGLQTVVANPEQRVETNTHVTLDEPESPIETDVRSPERTEVSET